MRIHYFIVAAALVLFVCTGKGRAEFPWPGEEWTAAVRCTHLDPDFRNNMSGACWNPTTRTFWVCCNGGPSAFWALREDGAGGLAIATNSAGVPAKYNLGQGDLEGICQVDCSAELVYLMFEGVDLIREYDVSTYGSAILRKQWNISAYVPTGKGLGSEGITFVPNAWLKRGGFTDAGGAPYASTNELGGLMFVAHQNGGRVYVFDLNHKNATVRCVGAYRTSRSESSGLEFDRSTGLLYVWHNTGPNYLEVTKLSSEAVGAERRLTSVVEFVGPKGGNLEGIAIAPAKGNDRWCLIVDDDNQDDAALMWFRQFNPAKEVKLAP
jgi:hypothetical protein